VRFTATNFVAGHDSEETWLRCALHVTRACMAAGVPVVCSEARKGSGRTIRPPLPMGRGVRRSRFGYWREEMTRTGRVSGYGVGDDRSERCRFDWTRPRIGR